jgi:actin-like protein 6A
MVSAFCNGRPTSLVIDIGARETRIIPVVDGYTLKNAVVVTKRGGNWIDKNIFSHLESNNNIPLKLWFDKSNQAFNSSSSFRNMHTMDIIQDIKKWMCFVPKDTLTPELLDSLKMPPYELPDGSKISPCIEICSLPGHLFSSDREHLKILNNFNASLPAHLQPIDIEHDESSLQELIQIAISKCDVDVRKDLLSNISLCGGGAGFDGLIPRLTHELSSIIPSNYKIKVLPLLPIERRFSAWIGGSILAICGTFQQLWISSKEYEEYGSNILLKSKCIY